MSDGDRSPAGQIAEYVRTHPDADPVEVLGALGLSPDHRGAVEDALGTESADNRQEEPDSPRPNPGGNADASDSSPAYADLYLAARERADTDTAYVPHEHVRAVFDAHGFGDLVDALAGLSDWLVWTPDGRDDPLYAYTPDLAGDTSDERARLADLLAEAGLGTERFIDAHDGQKGSFDTGNARPPDDPEIHGNYGVKGGRGGDDTAPWLVDLDIDDYDAAKSATDTVDDLRGDTLAVASAHTTVDDPGHLYIAVDGDPRAVVRDVLGRAVDNPQASFGEIRVDQQYVVGPGSEVLCGCDRCTDTDAGDALGRYELATERPPVVWTEAEFREFLLSDPKIAAEAERADRRDDRQDGDRDGQDATLADDADARLKVAKKADEYVAGALRDARAPTDRSAADAALARSVAPWVEYDERAIRDVLGDHGTDKWAGRTDDSYRGSVLDYATDRGVDAYDPLPYWALVEFAVTEGIVAEEDLVARDADTGEAVDDPEEYDGDTYRALPGADAYNRTLDAVEECGVDHGRDRAGGRQDPDAEPTAPFALGALDVLADDQAERFARKRGLDIPTTDDAREDLRDTVFREFRAERYTVVDAETALGKTDMVATEPWPRRTDVTGGAPVIQFHETREARDQAADRTEQTTGGGAVLRGRKEKSPLARGDHDPPEDPDAEDAPEVVVTIAGEPASDWLDRMCDRKGLPFSTALALAREHNDQGLDDLPPQGREDPAVTQWDGLPRDDDGDPAADVIHATHQFARVPSLRQHTNVVFDERPEFTVEFTESGDPEAETGRVRGMVGAYLREIDAPVSTWEEFVALATHDAHDTDAARERDALDEALGADPPTEWYVDHPDAHAHAPALSRAIWNALRWEDLDATGRRSTTVVHEPPRFDTDGDDYYAREYLTVVLDDTHTVRRVRSTPDFSQARAVVGLDAHPCMDLWRANTHPDMTRDAVLDPTERHLWRRFERGLTVVQIGDATRPRSGPNARRWMNDDRVRAALDRLRDHYGDDFQTAIAPDAVEADVRQALGEAGVDLPGDGFDTTEEHTMHYGEEKSRNDFAGERAGYVYGCVDPGDGYVLDTLAELGLDAEPERVDPDAVDDPEHAECPRCDGDGCRDCHDTGRKRAKGRGFVGPDADTAEAVLASVRENHVAQAAGRYARDPEDGDGAVVFVHTDATPPGFADLQVPGVEWLATDLQREIIDELVTRPSATARDLADAVDCSKEHVRETLATLAEEGLVRRRRATGDHGADVYREDGADTALADLGLGTPQTTNDPLQGPSRWSLAICDAGADATDADTALAGVTPGTVPVEGADRPPDPGD